MGPPPDISRLVASLTPVNDREREPAEVTERPERPRWLRDETLGFVPAPHMAPQGHRTSQRALFSVAEGRGEAAREPLAADEIETLSAMYDALSLADYGGAHLLAETLLDEAPDHPMALEAVALGRVALAQAERVEAGAPEVTASDLVPLDNRPTPPEPRAGIEALSPVALDSSMDEEVEQMFDRLASGNYPTALLLAENILERSPNNGDAEQCAGICRSEMRKQYALRLGSLSYVPQRLWSDEELASVEHDRVTRYVLARIDDESSIEQILDGAELPTLEVLRSLYELKVQGVLTLSPP